ncbi:hypothetical protein F9K33_11535 [bacterium]|nr:MAG: hypothetical protein F9K33_11535 [bacterium]
MEARKLSVIMFTDMVGYSKKVQENEDHALQLLNEHNKILEEKIQSYKGNIIKTIGDAFLADFDSVFNAVNCAVDIQQKLTERDRLVDPYDRVSVRIGIHVGDVIYRGQDVFGDGVNIASRIESVAGPGEIFISHDIYSIALGKLSYHFKDHGVKELKNISRPIHLYEVVWDPTQIKTASLGPRTKMTHKKKYFKVAVGLCVAAAIVAAVWLVLVPSIQKKQEPAKRPTLAVIAFSDDTGDERFQKVQIGRVINDAMVQKFYEFPAVQLVSPLRIARAMKELQIDDQSIAGKKELAEKVAKETNSRLMITGSLKKFGDTFILAADLNDLEEERLLGSFVLQEVKEESILGRLIDSLCMKFQMKISDEFSLKDTSKFKFLSINELTTKSLEAYSYLVRGWEMSMSGLFHPGIDEMIKAVEIDTNFALAYSLISCNASFNKEDSLSAVYGQKAFRFKDKFRGRTSKEALIFQGNLGWFENDVEECERNYRLITELYPDDREGYYYYGSYLAYLKKDYKKALEVYEKARTLTPDYFPVIRDIAYITKELRGADEGVKIIQEFIRNHPNDQSLEYARKMIAQFRGVM